MQGLGSEEKQPVLVSCLMSTELQPRWPPRMRSWHLEFHAQHPYSLESVPRPWEKSPFLGLGSVGIPPWPKTEHALQAMQTLSDSLGLSVAAGFLFTHLLRHYLRLRIGPCESTAPCHLL